MIKNRLSFNPFLAVDGYESPSNSDEEEEEYDTDFETDGWYSLCHAYKSLSML